MPKWVLVGQKEKHDGEYIYLHIREFYSHLHHEHDALCRYTSDLLHMGDVQVKQKEKPNEHTCLYIPGLYDHLYHDNDDLWRCGGGPVGMANVEGKAMKHIMEGECS